jgi:hypothetical protein
MLQWAGNAILVIRSGAHQTTTATFRILKVKTIMALDAGTVIDYAELDPQLALVSKQMLDVAGHCARPDVFELTVHRPTSPTIRVPGVSYIANAGASDRHFVSLTEAES